MTAEDRLIQKVIETEGSRLLFQQALARDLRLRKIRRIEFDDRHHLSGNATEEENDINGSKSATLLHFGTFDDAVEQSRLEYQQMYARALRQRRVNERDMELRLRTNAANLDAQLQQAHAEINALQSALSQKVSDHECAICSLESDRAELGEQLRDKERLNKTLVQELVVAAENLKKAENDHKEEQRLIREAFVAAQPVTTDTETQTGPDQEAIRNADMVVSLTAQVETLEEEKDDLNYRLEESVAEIDSAQEVAAQHEAANRLLKSSVGQLQDSLHVSAMKLTAANYEIERLTAEWNRERGCASSFKTALEDSLKDRELLKMRMEGMKQQVGEEGALLAEARQENAQLSASLTDATDEIEILQNELLYLHDSLRASGNNFEDIIVKARASSRLGRTREGPLDNTLYPDEPDEMAYTMEYERDESSPPGSAPVGVTGVRAIRSGRASADTSAADSEQDYQDEFLSPAKSTVTFPEIISTGVDDSGRTQDGASNKHHGNSGCEDDESSCTHSRHSKHSAGNKRKVTKKRSPKAPCSECQKRFKGKGMRLPTALHNLKVEDEPFKKKPAGEMSDVISTGGYHVLPGHLASQCAGRDLYTNPRGEDVMFCSWDCARQWNRKHTTVQLRHMTDRLICIAAGKF